MDQQDMHQSVCRIWCTILHVVWAVQVKIERFSQKGHMNQTKLATELLIALNIKPRQHDVVQQQCLTCSSAI